MKVFRLTVEVDGTPKATALLLDAFDVALDGVLEKDEIGELAEKGKLRYVSTSTWEKVPA